ncbi:MAG: c-type cytochrome [Gammaproteobacteria bacterium]
MRNNRDLLAGLLLLLAGLMGLAVLPGSCLSMGMTGGDMKSMMKDMMGAQLPLGIAPHELPDPQSSGARLLARYCTQCHELPSPGMHTAQEWPPVVARMNRRMRKMSGRGMMGGMMGRTAAPSDNERREIVEYLQRHAQMPIDISQYTDMNTGPGKAFQGVCAQCHALPDPKQHTAEEWPLVVARMKKNMAAMGKRVPDDSTLEEIVAFLQGHARGTQ